MRYKIGEIFNLQMGKTPDRNNQEYWNDGTNKWISIADLSKSGKCISNTSEMITEEAINKTGIKLIPENTVIMSFKLSIGKCAITKEKMFSNEAIMAFIDNGNVQIIPSYLYYNLMHRDWNPGTNKAVMGITLNKATLSRLPIEIHDYHSQQEIVKNLDELVEVINCKKRQLSLLDDLIKSRFVEMFGDFTTNSMRWPMASFENIAIIDCNMTTDYEKYSNYPHIGIDSIEKGTGKLFGYRTVKEDNVISGKYIFTKKHIIYSKIRPNLNKVALPDFCGLCSADAYPILPIESTCNREFLAYTMRSNYYLNYILKFCDRTSLPKVNKKEIQGFTTPLPPIELQNQFSDLVGQVDKSKFEIQNCLI